jgi:hypothetical protein
MKQTRREFLKSTGVIAASTALGSVLPRSPDKALDFMCGM